MGWGFGDNTISTNAARDLGPRLVAAIFFGPEAFTYGRGYAAIAVLVNIPAILCAVAYYECVVRDSLRQIEQGHTVHVRGEVGLARHLTTVGALPGGRRRTKEASGRRSGEVV